MTSRYQTKMFSLSVQDAQDNMGSKKMYARNLHDPSAQHADRLGPKERAFIAARDSFYIASIGAGGWPYLQHRGGPAGFLKTLGDGTLGFADFRGNRQYISLGNVADDDRVALFFMDYVNRARLKLMGRMRAVDLDPGGELAGKLITPEYRGKPERAFLIEVEAFDWNCHQHITQRFTAQQLVQAVHPLQTRIETLEAELKKERARHAT